jgi:hypothetical protein
MVGVYKYDEIGYTLLSRKYDKSCKYVYCVEIDGTPNIPLLKTAGILDRLKKDFFRGLVRVTDSGLQKMLMDVFG